MEIIIAFNGEEQLKRALLEKIQPEIIEKYRSQITLKIFDPIFGVRVVKTLEAFKCLCLFHGFTPSFKYLADVVGWGLPEHEASVWPSELILAIKPGIVIDDMETYLLEWFAHNSGLTTKAEYVPSDTAFIIMGEKLFEKNGPEKFPKKIRLCAYFMEWMHAVTMRKICTDSIGDQNEIWSMLTSASVIAGRVWTRNGAKEVRRGILDILRTHAVEIPPAPE